MSIQLLVGEKMGHLKDLDKIKFDTRLRDWNLKRGIISNHDISDHLSSLTDVSANAQSVELEEEESIVPATDVSLIQSGLL